MSLKALAIAIRKKIAGLSQKEIIASPIVAIDTKEEILPMHFQQVTIEPMLKGDQVFVPLWLADLMVEHDLAVRIEQSYVCSVCKKAFSTLRGLKTHCVNKNHFLQYNEMLSISCPMCKRCFY